MGWTETVVKGGEQRVLPPRMFIYGPAGVGKSTFGSRLPKPIFIDFDKGIDDVRVDRVGSTPKTWSEALVLVRDIAATPAGYGALIIDTVDPLEELAMDHVAREAGKSFQKMNDDYGSGYIAVAAQWKLLLAELDVARKNGMLVCLLGHAIVRQAQDPQLGSFDQFTSNLGKKSWALTTRWVDVVGFTTFDAALAARKDDQRIIVTGERVLYTVRGTGYEAKNRFALPPRIALDWPTLKSAIETHRSNSESLKARITTLSKGDAELETKAAGFVKDAGDDVLKLQAILSGLELKLESRKVEQAPAALPANTIPSPPPANDALSPSSPETIETRIRVMSKGTPFESKAEGYMLDASKDITKLLKIEEALKKGLQKTNTIPTQGAST